MTNPSFLIVAYPLQGHITPALRLAHRLALVGAAEVTFVTTISAFRRSQAKYSHAHLPTSISFAPFSDGHDDDDENSLTSGSAYEAYYAKLRRLGSEALLTLIACRPYACVIYTPLFHWATDVATQHRVPAVLLWVQSATVFDINYYYFHDFGDIIAENYSRRSEKFDLSLSLPGLPLEFAARDLPSYMVDTADNWFHANLVAHVKQQFETVSQSTQQTVPILVNTFDALESEALRAVGKLRLIGVGPLVPIDRSDRKPTAADVAEWLRLKPRGSVVYVSFGSISGVTSTQVEEIAKGLSEFGRPVLWVLPEGGTGLGEVGMIVRWCDQVEVLASEAVGCFVSHCGWNSTLESLACGVPIVAIPRFVDQTTNAKLVEDFWKVGARARANEDGIVGSGELRRCLEMVMDAGEEIKKNAIKWKTFSGEAGETLDTNLKAFVEEMFNGHRLSFSNN